MASEGPTFILQVLSGSFASVPLVLGGAGNSSYSRQAPM